MFFFVVLVYFSLFYLVKLEKIKLKQKRPKKGHNPPKVGGMRGLVGYPTNSFKLQSYK
jgi:hypothetical protein